MGRAAKKAKKDADNASGKPKRPAGGAYGVYVAHHRSEIHKSLPAGSTVAAVSKIAGERWKALSAKDRQKYEDEYKVKKTKFDADLKMWQENHGGDNDDDDADDDDAAAGGA